MIGFDRPLRPEWIYETLQLMECGRKASAYHEAFETIAKELVGKQGKRKARTVLFRSFVYPLQDGRTIAPDNEFIHWAKHDTLHQLSPLFLMKLLMDYDIARCLVQKMAISTDSSHPLSVALLTKHLVKTFGDREVVKRALRSLLATLVHFNVLEKADHNTFLLKEKQPLSHEQVKKFILLYARTFIRSRVIHLDALEPEFLYFFQPVDLTAVGRAFHGTCWEYIREVERNMLILREVGNQQCRGGGSLDSRRSPEDSYAV